jgi:hypothetical protein
MAPIPSRQIPCWPFCIQVDNAARYSGNLSSPNVLCRLPCSKMSLVVYHSPPRKKGSFPSIGHSSPLREGKDPGDTSDQRHGAPDGSISQPYESVPVTKLTQHTSSGLNSSAQTENVCFLRERLAGADIIQGEDQHSALGYTESLLVTVCSSRKGREIR